MRGKLLISLNITLRPIANNKYREGRLQRTLKREFNNSWKCVAVYTVNSALVTCGPDHKWLCSFSGMSIGCISSVVYSRNCLEWSLGEVVSSARGMIHKAQSLNFQSTLHRWKYAEHTNWDPKDGELCLARLKSGETMMEDHINSDVEINCGPVQVWAAHVCIRPAKASSLFYVR